MPRIAWIPALTAGLLTLSGAGCGGGVDTDARSLPPLSLPLLAGIAYDDTNTPTTESVPSGAFPPGAGTLLSASDLAAVSNPSNASPFYFPSTATSGHYARIDLYFQAVPTTAKYARLHVTGSVAGGTLSTGGATCSPSAPTGGGGFQTQLWIASGAGWVETFNPTAGAAFTGLNYFTLGSYPGGASVFTMSATGLSSSTVATLSLYSLGAASTGTKCSALSISSIQLSATF